MAKLTWINRNACKPHVRAAILLAFDEGVLPKDAPFDLTKHGEIVAGKRIVARIVDEEAVADDHVNLLDANTEDVATLQAAIDKLQADIDKRDAVIFDLNGNLATAEGEIIDLNGKLEAALNEVKATHAALDQAHAELASAARTAHD